MSADDFRDRLDEITLDLTDPAVHVDFARGYVERELDVRLPGPTNAIWATVGEAAALIAAGGLDPEQAGVWIREQLRHAPA